MRNIFHMLGCAIPLSYVFFGKEFALTLVTLSFATVSILEVFRLKGYFRPKILDRVLKTKEREAPTGSFFFLLSSLLVILLFEKRAAILSLIMLSFCDPLASFVGTKFGKKRWMGKSLEGSGIYFLTGLLILLVAKEDIEKAIFVSFVSTLTEFFSTRIDDNLTTPIVTAFMLQFLNL